MKRLLVLFLCVLSTNLGFSQVIVYVDETEFLNAIRPCTPNLEGYNSNVNGPFDNYIEFSDFSVATGLQAFQISDICIFGGAGALFHDADIFPIFSWNFDEPI